jgi:hypothetical protein
MVMLFIFNKNIIFEQKYYFLPILYIISTVMTLVFYLMVSLKDPGYVLTNLFKIETENSVINITEEMNN